MKCASIWNFTVFIFSITSGCISSAACPVMFAFPFCASYAFSTVSIVCSSTGASQNR